MYLRFFFNNAKFHMETGSRFADIKNFCPGGNGFVQSPLPPFMDEGNG